MKKRVYLIGSQLSLYLFCADGHDFLPVAKARLKDTRSNTDGDAMRALFLKSQMAEPYVRQAMEYYQRLIHVQNGQPNGNTVEDAMVRVLESLADVSEEDRKILSQNKNFIRHLKAFAETAADRDAKENTYHNALVIACILLFWPVLLVYDKDVPVLLFLLCGFGFILPAAAKWGGCCTNTAKRAMFPPAAPKNFRSSACP